MAGEGAERSGGLLDLEKELTCSICTDILYQPLTLLDCLHTFCGGCVKEWFAWQATSVANSNKRHTGSPYTCPSCRDSVRGTKADWRLTALLEGFLKANPDKGKPDEDKAEMRKHYQPGEDIIPPVEMTRAEGDSEDERLMADIMDLSLANVDPEIASRRTERAARERQRRRQGRGQTHTPEERSRQLQSSRWVAQQAEIRQQETERQVEHQPSLRSLLSNSDISSEDVQQEILQSIYSEGLLNGIDIDNLTPAQEEELTERIAEAYRRRQRHRDRSRNRDRESSSIQAQTRRATSPRAHIAHQQQPQSRPRPPISRPHLFEQQAAVGAERHHRRSASSGGQSREGPRQEFASNASPAARSAIDVSAVPLGEPIADGRRPRALSSNVRSTTDPARMSDDVHRARATSNSLRPAALEPSHRPRGRDTRSAEPTRRQTGPSSSDSATVLPLAGQRVSSANAVPQQEVQPVVSAAALAVEPVSPNLSHTPNQGVLPGSVACSNCHKPDIGVQLHYNCSKCESGLFNLCLGCYRNGKGCHHWYGFGLVAIYRWQKAAEQASDSQSVEYPHLLTPRKYTASISSATDTAVSSPEQALQEGAFCESCLSYSNDCYWYCNHCLDGAWGYCNSCVLKGRHCTHPLLAIAHISTLRNSDPSRIPLCLPVPHLKQDSYVLLPVLTDCDVCRQPINLRETRFHCYQCSEGDYDICNECYHSLVAVGKISSANGPNGWRRCLQGHRMAVVGYQDTPTPAGPAKVRVTMREMVGGWRLKDDVAAHQNDRRAVPPDAGSNTNAIAIWSRWPKEEEQDELSFPKNAELRESEDLNPDWGVAVYAGKVGLVPKNYTRRL